MSIGAWIVLGLVVAVIAFFASRASGGSRTGSGKSDVLSRYEKADALALELGRQCVELAEALPVVDEQTSWLLHEPIYDARTDFFDPPCVESEFDYSWGRCWVAGEGLGDVFWRWSEDEARARLDLLRPRTTSLIRAADYIDIVWCFYSVNEPGLQVVRLCRVEENRWHKHVWQCGLGSAGTIAIGSDDARTQFTLASDSGGLDPPLLARDVAENPSLWTQRNDLLRARWSADRSWREAVTHCKHLPAK